MSEKKASTTNRGNQLNPSHKTYHKSRGAMDSTANNNASQAGSSGNRSGKK